MRVFVLLMTAMSLPLLGGTDLGNGGDVMICEPEGGPKTVELIDVYEAREIYRWPHRFGPSQNYLDMASYAVERLSDFDSLRYERYKKRIQTFEQDSRLLENTKITEIQDENPVIVPGHCRIKQLAIQYVHPAPGMPRYLIEKSTWDQIDHVSKAYLVLHEIIYYEALRRGASNSKYSRKLVGLLASEAIEGMSREEYGEFLDSLEDIPSLDKHYGLVFRAESVRFYPSGEFRSGKIDSYVDESVAFTQLHRTYTWGKYGGGAIEFYRNGIVKDVKSLEEFTIDLADGGYLKQNYYPAVNQTDNGCFRIVTSKPVRLRSSRGCYVEVGGFSGVELDFDADNRFTAAGPVSVKAHLGTKAECAFGEGHGYWINADSFYDDGSPKGGRLIGNRDVILLDGSLKALKDGSEIELNRDGRVSNF